MAHVSHQRKLLLIIQAGNLWRNLCRHKAEIEDTDASHTYKDKLAHLVNKSFLRYKRRLANQ